MEGINADFCTSQVVDLTVLSVCDLCDLLYHKSFVYPMLNRSFFVNRLPSNVSPTNSGFIDHIPVFFFCSNKHFTITAQ